MKKYFFIIIVSFIFNSCGKVNKNVNSDSIIGIWELKNYKTRIEIFKKENKKYYGKISSFVVNDSSTIMTEDIKNPNKELQKRPMQGLEIISDFEFNNSSFKWENGKIYDPSQGKTYDCSMWFEKKSTDELHIKGFIKFEMIGRQELWYRVEKIIFN